MCIFEIFVFINVYYSLYVLSDTNSDFNYNKVSLHNIICTQILWY